MRKKSRCNAQVGRPTNVYSAYGRWKQGGSGGGFNVVVLMGTEFFQCRLWYMPENGVLKVRTDPRQASEPTFES